MHKNHGRHKNQGAPPRRPFSCFKHHLSGNHLAMQPHEFEAYEFRQAKTLADLKPASEMERQIAQKIIDINFRLNRLSAIENNMLNFDLGNNFDPSNPDERAAGMAAQAKAWKQDAQSFEILGRYEGRLSRQLLQYQREFERLQSKRKAEAVHATSVALSVQPTETVPLNPELASFGRTMHAALAASLEPATPLPPPARLRVPQPPELPVAA